MGAEEKKIQSEIVKAARDHKNVAWCYVTSTGTYKGIKGGRLIRIGLNGMPDILGQMINGRIFGIEVKTAGKKASQNQADFIQMMRNNGAIAGCVDNVADAISLLDSI